VGRNIEGGKLTVEMQHDLLGFTGAYPVRLRSILKNLALRRLPAFLADNFVCFFCGWEEITALRSTQLLTTNQYTSTIPHFPNFPESSSERNNECKSKESKGRRTVAASHSCGPRACGRMSARYSGRNYSVGPLSGSRGG